VRIGDQRAKLLGPIGATETVLDVTNLKCSAGDLATFDVDPLFAKGFTIEYR
jgi:alanine racemase